MLRLACAASLVAAAGWALWRASKSPAFQFFGEIVPRVETRERVVALTFDDGPTPAGTEAVLRVLEESGVRATFFLTGGELERNMDEGRRIASAGHELGNHSYSHRRMVLVTPAFVRDEVERTDRLIREAGYGGEIHFRPPFGRKLFVLPYYLARAGRKTVTWDVEPESDPEAGSDAGRIVEHVRRRARPGSIILLHVMYPSRSESLKAVRGIAEALSADGYRFVTVSELLSTAR